MPPLIDRLAPLLLGGLLAAVPCCLQAKNVKPDPNGLAPHPVEDLAYGEIGRASCRERVCYAV